MTQDFTPTRSIVLPAWYEIQIHWCLIHITNQSIRESSILSSLCTLCRWTKGFILHSGVCEPVDCSSLPCQRQLIKLYRSQK